MHGITLMINFIQSRNGNQTLDKTMSDLKINKIKSINI